MIQRSVILLLIMVVWVGCGEDEPDKVKPKEVVDEKEVLMKDLKKESSGRRTVQKWC